MCCHRCIVARGFSEYDKGSVRIVQRQNVSYAARFLSEKELDINHTRHRYSVPNAKCSSEIIIYSISPQVFRLVGLGLFLFCL